MISKERIEASIRDSKGNYYLLKISPLCKDVKNEDFIPDDPSYPNVYRYHIYSYNKETDMYESPIIEDIEVAQAVIKRLKEIHGIKDLWDKDVDYFKKKLKQNNY